MLVILCLQVKSTPRLQPKCMFLVHDIDLPEIGLQFQFEPCDMGGRGLYRCTFDCGSMVGAWDKGGVLCCESRGSQCRVLLQRPTKCTLPASYIVPTPLPDLFLSLLPGGHRYYIGRMLE